MPRWLGGSGPAILTLQRRNVARLFKGRMLGIFKDAPKKPTRVTHLAALLCANAALNDFGTEAEGHANGENSRVPTARWLLTSASGV